MDTLFIRELRLPAWIGLHKYEKIAPQTVQIDIDIEISGDAVFKTRRVRDTIDYAVVAGRIKELLATERFGLVEVLADRVARMVLEEFKSPRVKLTVTKFGMLKDSGRVGVCVERTR